MCGIAGIYNPNGAAAELEATVRPMQEALAHRGPDGKGLFSEEEIALGHTRLSIIDLAGGSQPLANEDKTVWLVANGEIYNYRALERTLTGRGHRFRTRSDCEVILHLYEEHGEACLEYLEGMFALALWDAGKKRLLLARDRFGIKPLYIAREADTLYFASELTAILRAYPRDKVEVDSRALYAYMAFSYVPGPRSILKGIEKLQPAERMIVEKGSIRRSRYWQLRNVPVPSSRPQAMEELEHRLEQSVRSHLVADVPVAAFLSGGVDSSTVVAMAQRHQSLQTFCVSFAGTEIDEAPIARRVASHLGTRHEEITLAMSPADLLTEVMETLDEPFADSSALPTFAVCRAARRIAKVVLSGDGGDEVFGGYTGRYRVAALKAVLPRPRTIARLLRHLPPWSLGKRSSLPEMLELAALTAEERYVREREITSAPDRCALFGYQGAERIEAEEFLRQTASSLIPKIPHRHPVHRALFADIATSLPDDMLTKVDRMSMANGLEVRVPLLDHHLVEFALSLPAAWLVSPLPVEGKRLLRRVAAPLLPMGILNRPKQGFVVPLNRWLAESLLPPLGSLFEGGNAKVFQFMDRSAIRKLLENPAGRKSRADIYALLVLELWFRRITGDRS